MPVTLQAKLLRVLQEGTIRPVGATSEKQVDVRIICATNRDLAAEVEKGRFRQDLYYRLMVFPIKLPPLRERREDILPLADHFIGQYARKYGKPARDIPAAVAGALQAYDWPGNVRALRHACERAVILADGAAFTSEDFSLSRGLAPSRAAPAPAPIAAPRHDLNLDRAEKQLVEEALKKHSYNISLAAAELGLTRASLYRRMEKHGL
jgi:DNA-binding NtrC family response regulator